MDKLNETLPSSSREMRNRAEKQRRDKLNAYISELYSLVPSAAAAPRKLDKTSTLRLSANFLRIHQNVDLRVKPYNRWNAVAGHSILEKLDSFLLVVSCCSGKIIYVTDRVEKLLGHAQVDMMGYQLSCFVHQADQEAIEKRLSAFAAQVASNPTGADSLDGQVYSFECRLAGRQPSRGEPTVYERVSVSGTFRGPRRRRDRYHKSSDKSVASVLQHNDYTEPLFVGLVRMLQTPNTLPPLTIMQAVQDEYITQHTMTGTIMRTDHRIAVIAGYMSGEVTGMSAYDYVFKEDLDYTLKAQSLMLSRSEGMVTYRLRTSTGRLIFLRTRGFMERDENTKEVLSFFCINTLIDDEQGMKEMKEMRAMLDKLNIEPVTPSIASSPTNSVESLSSSSASQPLAINHCVQTFVGKAAPSAPTNGCHPAITISRNSSGGLGSTTSSASSSSSNSSNSHCRVTTLLSRPSVMPNGSTANGAASLCISPAASELQYSPSESSLSSSFCDERSHSTTPHSTVSSPMEIPNLVTVAYPFPSVPFPWRPSSDLSTLATTPATNGLVKIQDVTNSQEIGWVHTNGIHEPGLLAVSLNNRLEATTTHPSIVIQPSGPFGQPSEPLVIANVSNHHAALVPSSDQVIESVRSTLNPPSVSPIEQVARQHLVEDAPLSMSNVDNSSTEPNRNSFLNGYIIWPQTKTQKDSLILSYLEADKIQYKKSELVTNDQHYYNISGELKVNTGTNSA